MMSHDSKNLLRRFLTCLEKLQIYSSFWHDFDKPILFFERIFVFSEDVLMIKSDLIITKKSHFK